MAISRIRTVMTGVEGGPYFTNMYFQGVASQTVIDAVTAFWAEIDEHLPVNTAVVVEGQFPVLDEATGDTISLETLLSGSHPVANIAERMALATQGLIRLTTDGLVNNRRVEGRTFIPSGNEVDNNLGTTSAAYRSSVATAHFNLIGAVSATNPLVVWSRPFEGSPTVDPRVGSSHLVTGSLVNDQWSVLRSRRD